MAKLQDDLPDCAVRSVKDDGIPRPKVSVIFQEAVCHTEFPYHCSMLDGHEVNRNLEQIFLFEDGEAAPRTSTLLERDHPIVLAQSFDAWSYLDHHRQAIVPGHERRFRTNTISCGTCDHSIEVAGVDGDGPEVHQHFAPFKLGWDGLGVHFQRFFWMSHGIALDLVRLDGRQWNGFVAAFDDAVLFCHVFCGEHLIGRLSTGV
mmetsp:Transcript_7795/g.48340  ORF Transcript_7795/g.48340 Transcript_7795/m.48340 type:complete len:204 (-) Transcript_7795:406-1017(-)